MKNFIILSSIFVLVSQTGCASFNRKLKAFLGGTPPPAQAQGPKKPESIKYSQASNLPPAVKRKYQRVTRETLEKDAVLGEKSGSLWVMEGQGAYLFSQNIMRMVGDPLAVELEGDPKAQLEAKVDVIRDLLVKLEERQKARLRQPASRGPDGAAGAEGAQEGKEVAKTPPPPKADGGQEEEFNVKTVPTRVVERTVDGNYRVKGDQPFIIKGREYKVIVTGVVRAEDFNDEGLGASKLLDPKFDIVSVKRSESANL